MFLGRAMRSQHGVIQIVTVRGICFLIKSELISTWAWAVTPACSTAARVRGSAAYGMSLERACAMMMS